MPGIGALATKSWYRWFVRAALLAAVVKYIDAQRGPDFPSWIGQIPNEPFILVIGVILLPIYVHIFDQARKVNMAIYDPESADIKAAAKRHTVIGASAFALAAVFVVAAILSRPDMLDRLPVWAVTAPMVILIGIGAFSLHHAQLMRAGLWSPPSWMPPMSGRDDKLDEDETGDSISREDDKAKA